ncbi:MAG: hypothetical protein HY554_10225 [Elusimicrobia bacterium]|nr:hypothetical protein [Elusimicrobiota bacterium]
MNGLRRELRRKGWHLFLLLYLVVFLMAGQRAFLPWMLGWTAVVAVVETLRLRSAAVRDALAGPFSGIMREHEASCYSGVLYATLGVLGSAVLFGHEPRVVTAALLYLAFADTASALAGLAWGRRLFTILGSRRSLEGTAAGAGAALLCGAAAGLPWPATLAGAAAFAAVDSVPVPPNDNLWIPLASSFAVGAALGRGPAWPW